MSSSEEEEFNIEISDDESQEDYAPLVKKKTATTVCFSVSTLMDTLTYILVEGEKEWCKGYYEEDCQETPSEAQGSEESSTRGQG